MLEFWKIRFRLPSKIGFDMKFLFSFATIATLLPMAVSAANPVSREDVTRPESPVFIQEQNEAAPKGVLGTFYNYKNASGGGAAYNASTLTLAYWQKLNIVHTQYFMLSGNAADFKRGEDSNDTNSGTFTYGRLWHSPYLMTRFYLSGHLGFDRTSNNANSDVKVAKHAGISGGATRIFPINERNTSEISLGFNLGYVDLPDGTNSKGNGFDAALYPSVRHMYKISQNLTAHAGIGGAFGTDSINLNRDNALYNANIGLTHKIGKGALGVGYTHEFENNHNGQNFTVNFTHPF